MNHSLALPDILPTSPTAAPALNWAILGTGYIAKQFALSLKLTTSRVAAVGSREQTRSAAFAQDYGDAQTGAHPDFTAAINDPAVDAVYVAVPHSAHCELALEAIRAGKHVLVEKPFALDSGQAQQMVSAAREAGVFAMEAMWSRFTPAGQILRALLERGTLGKIRSVNANLGQHFPYVPGGRIHDPALGGGALLDLGIYPVALSSLVCGPPRILHAMGRITETGVDAYSTLVMENRDGSLSTLQSSIEFHSSCDAWISGEQGTLEIQAPLYSPSGFVLRELDGTIVAEQKFAETTPPQGLAWEAAHVASCLAQGLQESPLMPLYETVQIARVLEDAAALLRCEPPVS